MGLDPVALLGEVAERYPGLPWTVGFSGGKDSTLTVHFVVRAVEEYRVKGPVYVVYTDTLIEHPRLRALAYRLLESLESYSAARLGGAVRTVVLKPAPGEDFISMMVLRGYPAPSHRFRWCMDRLKLRPFRRFARSLGRHVEVSGVRLGESGNRARTLKKNMLVGRVVEAGDRIVVMPILDWSTSEVLEYLRTHKRWDGGSYQELLELYDAAGEAGADGVSVRFGCWACTVARREKMPVPPLLRWARQRILEISRDPRYRTVDQAGRLRGLNSEGRREIARVFLRVAEEMPEALGYDINELKSMLREILMSFDTKASEDSNKLKVERQRLLYKTVYLT